MDLPSVESWHDIRYICSPKAGPVPSCGTSLNAMHLFATFPDVRHSFWTMQDEYDPFQWRSSDCPFVSLRPEDFTDRCVIGRGRSSPQLT